eukprot:scaffold33215_cov63-Phaeocystis_antarctica.AAC.1
MPLHGAPAASERTHAARHTPTTPRRSAALRAAPDRAAPPPPPSPSADPSSTTCSLEDALPSPSLPPAAAPAPRPPLPPPALLGGVASCSDAGGMGSCSPSRWPWEVCSCRSSRRAPPSPRPWLLRAAAASCSACSRGAGRLGIRSPGATSSVPPGSMTCSVRRERGAGGAVSAAPAGCSTPSSTPGAWPSARARRARSRWSAATPERARGRSGRHAPCQRRGCSAARSAKHDRPLGDGAREQRGERDGRQPAGRVKQRLLLLLELQLVHAPAGGGRAVGRQRCRLHGAELCGLRGLRHPTPLLRGRRLGRWRREHRVGRRVDGGSAGGTGCDAHEQRSGGRAARPLHSRQPRPDRAGGCELRTRALAASRAREQPGELVLGQPLVLRQERGDPCARDGGGGGGDEARLERRRAGARQVQQGVQVLAPEGGHRPHGEHRYRLERPQRRARGERRGWPRTRRRRRRRWRRGRRAGLASIGARAA